MLEDLKCSGLLSVGPLSQYVNNPWKGKMSDGANPVSHGLSALKLARTLLVVNFILLAALIGPGRSHKLYSEGRKLGVAHVIVHSLQFWFVASTTLVVALVVRILISKSEMWRAQRPTKLDWALFLGWIFVVTILCLFAFMMGMGG